MYREREMYRYITVKYTIVSELYSVRCGPEISNLDLGSWRFGRSPGSSSQRRSQGSAPYAIQYNSTLHTILYQFIILYYTKI